MANEELSELERNVSKELAKSDALLDSMGKRYSHLNNLGKIAADIAKDKLKAEERISLLQDSIAKKVKNIAELEDLRNINIKERGNLGHEIKKEQLEYLKLVQEETAELNKQKGILDQHAGKLLFLDKSGMQGILSKSKEWSQIFKANPMAVAGLVSLYIFKQIWNVFDSLDFAAADFRKSMGITRITSKQMEMDVRSIAVNYMALGITAKDLYESIRAIADNIGSSQSYSNDMVKDMGLLSSQFGITAQTSAKFLKSMAMVSTSTIITQKNMLLVAQRMSAAAGVPLDSVMEDVASASQDSYQFMARNSLEVLKAAVQARILGTSLESSAKSAGSLLNFTESVKNEMEASVLLGKSINLQKARELAYHRDITGLNREIVKLAKESNFEQLDAFQQDAVARALGKSAGEIAGMLESDREHSNVLRAMTSEQRKQYELLTKVNQSQLKDYAELARKEIESQNNQKAIATISAAWHSIFAQIGAVILPKIATVLLAVASTIRGISNVLGYLNEKTNGWSSGLLLSGLVIGLIIKSVKMLNSGLTFLGRPAIQFGKIFKDSFVFIRSFVGQIISFGVRFLGIFSKVGSFISRMVTPLTRLSGLILPGIMGLLTEIAGAFAGGWFLGKFLNTFKFVQKTAQDFFLLMFSIGDAFKKGIVDGLLAIGKTIIYALFSPFIAAYNMVMAIWGGHSPSEIGMSIVKGVLAIEDMLFNALISPFKSAWNFIKTLPFISHLFGGKNIGVESLPQPNATMVVDRPKNDIDAKKATNSMSDSVSGMGDEMTKRMGAIVDAINNLRDDMKNGTLTANVYLDSQKLDSAVGRRVSYTGTLT